jgi:hypothetical protein
VGVEQDDLLRLPEVFSFFETLLQPGATGYVRKIINVISEYDKVFAGKVRKTGIRRLTGFCESRVQSENFGIRYRAVRESNPN